MNILSDLNDIQPRVTQVWSFDDIGFDPNGRCNKFICNYKLFQAEKMWKVQTGERAPFWCMLLVFTQAYGQCFMPPISVQQTKDYSKDIHFNIPMDWTSQNTPYGCMDRYGWIESKDQLPNIFGASPVNNKTIFNEHGS